VQAAARSIEAARVAPPPWHGLAREASALIVDLLCFGQRADLPMSLPHGDGHAVMVIPALFCSDVMTRRFRNRLAVLGYRVEGWGAGINIGPTQAAWDAAAWRCQLKGVKVSFLLLPVRYCAKSAKRSWRKCLGGFAGKTRVRKVGSARRQGHP
jgi:hypothetical protein